MKLSGRTLVLVSSFVTLTSKVQDLGGPPLFAVMLTVILPSETSTIDAVGDGPQPFSNVTEAPILKPLPVISTSLRVAPFTITSSEMAVTVTASPPPRLLVTDWPAKSSIILDEESMMLPVTRV